MHPLGLAGGRAQGLAALLEGGEELGAGGCCDRDEGGAVTGQPFSLGGIPLQGLHGI